VKFLNYIFIVFISTSLFAGDFDDDFDEDAVVEVSSVKNSNFDTSVSTNIFSSYNYSHSDEMKPNNFDGISSTKINIDIDMQYKFKGYKLKANIKGYKDFIYDIREDDYPIIPNGYDEYIDINKLYIQGSLSDSFDFKIGRQIITWGKSDYLSLLDILSPRDNRLLGLMDIKDIKLGRTMAKFDYAYKNYTISAIGIVENRYSLLPQKGSDFAPYFSKEKLAMMKKKGIRLPTPSQEPENNIENMGLAVNLQGEFEGQDIGLYMSSLYLDGSDKKSNMIGSGYNLVIDNILLKSEIAYFDDKETMNALIGFDYTIKNGFVGFEVSIKDIDKNNDISYVARVSKSYINQTLNLELLYMGFGTEIAKDYVAKASVDYSINDNLSINGGIIDYYGENVEMLKMIGNNDRVYFNLKFTY
jgi:hypothetical protein